MSAAPKSPILVNVEAMRLTFRTTFQIPPRSRREKLRVGDFAKVATSGERFWVCVERVTAPGCYVGRVDQELAFSHLHRIKDGDALQFSAVNIYDISKRELHLTP